MFIVLGFLCLACAAVLLGEAVTAPARERRSAVTGAIALAGIAFIAPVFVVSGKARSRKDRIRAQLPDALDLMAVSVEAGMGFDGAIAKLMEYMDGQLADEFA